MGSCSVRRRYANGRGAPHLKGGVCRGTLGSDQQIERKVSYLTRVSVEEHGPRELTLQVGNPVQAGGELRAARREIISGQKLAQAAALEHARKRSRAESWPAGLLRIPGSIDATGGMGPQSADILIRIPHRQEICTATRRSLYMDASASPGANSPDPADNYTVRRPRWWLLLAFAAALRIVPRSRRTLCARRCELELTESRESWRAIPKRN